MPEIINIIMAMPATKFINVSIIEEATPSFPPKLDAANGFSILIEACALKKGIPIAKIAKGIELRTTTFIFSNSNFIFILIRIS